MALVKEEYGVYGERREFRVPYPGFVGTYGGNRGRITRRAGRNVWWRENGTNSERMFSLRADGQWREFPSTSTEGLDF